MTPAPTQPEVKRSAREIQRAHDILHFLTDPSENPPVIYDREGAIAASAVHDALAWILGYECGESFQSNLDGILAELKRCGFREIDAGELKPAGWKPPR